MSVDTTVRPFADVLVEQRKGLLHAELSDYLNDLVARVRELGKPGSLTVVLKVSPAGEDVVSVKDEIRVSLPNPDRTASIFYVDSENNLSRRHPNQTELPLHAVRDAAAAGEAGQ